MGVGDPCYKALVLNLVSWTYMWNFREFLNPKKCVQFSSVHSVVSNSLRPHVSQHARPFCPSPTPRVYSNSCPLSRWCHPAISFPVKPFSSCPQSLPASGFFPTSQLFSWSGQSIGVSVYKIDIYANLRAFQWEVFTALSESWKDHDWKSLRQFFRKFMHRTVAIWTFVWLYEKV